MAEGEAIGLSGLCPLWSGGAPPRSSKLSTIAYSPFFLGALPYPEYPRGRVVGGQIAE